jgi:hypothetical protein
MSWSCHVLHPIPEWKVESLYMVTLPHQDKKIFRSTSYLTIPQKTNEFTLNNFSSWLAIQVSVVPYANARVSVAWTSSVAPDSVACFVVGAMAGFQLLSYTLLRQR